MERETQKFSINFRFKQHEFTVGESMLLMRKNALSRCVHHNIMELITSFASASSYSEELLRATAAELKQRLVTQMRSRHCDCQRHMSCFSELYVPSYERVREGKRVICKVLFVDGPLRIRCKIYFSAVSAARPPAREQTLLRD